MSWTHPGYVGQNFWQRVAEEVRFLTRVLHVDDIEELQGVHRGVAENRELGERRFFFKRCPANMTSKSRFRTLAFVITLTHQRASKWLAKLPDEQCRLCSSIIDNVNVALEDEGIDVLSYPLYSPKLVPCDLWFSRLEESLSGRGGCIAIDPTLPPVRASASTNNLDILPILRTTDKLSRILRMDELRAPNASSLLLTYLF